MKYLFPQPEPLTASHLFEGSIDLSGESAAGKVSVHAGMRELRYEPAEGESDPEVELGGDYRRGLMSVTASDSANRRQVDFEVDRRKEFEPPTAPLEFGGQNTRFLSPVHHRVDHGVIRTLSDLLEGGAKPTILSVLQEVDPTVEDIIVAVRGGRSPEVRVLRKGQGGIPLSSEGDGVRRMLALAAEAFALMFPYSGKPGVLLVDEIETALHTSAMDKALRLLKLVSDVKKSSRHDLQILATTHSLEVMDAVAEVWSAPSPNLPMLSGPDAVAFFRLPAAGSSGPVVRYSWEEYRERREEAGMDLR